MVTPATCPDCTPTGTPGVFTRSYHTLSTALYSDTGRNPDSLAAFYSGLSPFPVIAFALKDFITNRSLFFFLPLALPTSFRISAAVLIFPDPCLSQS